MRVAPWLVKRTEEISVLQFSGVFFLKQNPMGCDRQKVGSIAAAGRCL